MKLIRSFIKGKMNKSVDERLVPDGEYVDALNVRVGSTETTDIGALENTKGNTKLTTLQYLGQNLSEYAVCIGVFEDGSEDVLYWFVHDPNSPVAGVGKVDMIVSYNVIDGALTYHVITPALVGANTVLNFNPAYLINGINKIENFLFFTDNYNAPRRIDVTENYLSPALSNDDRLKVIRKPPLFAPTLALSNINKEINYLENKFISFAYRWKYKTGEYSSLSPFSEIAFEPQAFRLNTNNYTNDGMLNSFNQVTVTVNAGDVNEVEEIQVCFKFGDETIIKVAEEIEADGTSTTYDVDFDNSKNYTVLPQSEILRLYDNVPRLAKAQTLMGNRIMYGNYLEGYDLSRDGSPTDMAFSLELDSNDINFRDYTVSSIQSANNSTMLSGSTLTNPQSAQIINFDLSGFSMVKDSVLTLSMDIEHAGWYTISPPPAGLPAYPTNIGSGAFTITLQYTLPQYYATVYDLITSTGFLQAVGVLTGIKDIDQCATGHSLTDVFNCNVNPNPTSDWAVFESGYANTVRPIDVIPPSPVSSNTFGLRILSASFKNTSGTAYAYGTLGEIFQITGGQAYSSSNASLRSLHSNRNYEVAIEYLDDYGRASTALISNTNSIYVPCSAMVRQNKIKVRIPPEQVAPSWATHYRFLMKPDKDQYQTIYATNWYDDLEGINNNTWMQLQGENQRKVEAGSFLFPKIDVTGSLGSCCLTEVLDKDVYSRNFLSGDDTATPVTLQELPGTYMTLKPQCFNLDNQNVEVLTNNIISCSSKAQPGIFTSRERGSSNPIIGITTSWKYLAINYPIYQGSGTVSNPIKQWNIEAGALVEMQIEVLRENSGTCGGSCGARKTLLDISYTASQDYANLKQFFEGEGIEAVWNNAPDPSIDCIDSNFGSGNTIYYSALGTGSFGPASEPIINTGQPSYFADGNLSQLQFFEINNTGSGDDYLYMRVVGGYPFCDNAKKKNKLSVDITITNQSNQVAFETEASTAIDNLYYEGSDTYTIDAATGAHLGIAANGDTSQVINADPALSTDGIINLSFFNCFAFGNGVESYRILDSIGEQFFLLGSRTNTVIDEEYKAIRRFADITYSGTYQTEQNINRLNEFNLGLANFKSCEQEFGEIQVLDSRRTDVLTLQEDKISYVLAGKNLLSDAVGGGAVTSVPEVLGKQIARVEQYGISNNPESYIQWGKEKFFTDAKRGVVLKLEGVGESESLQIISDTGMDSWFRDLFQGSFFTQKIGGYDPYMDEYVLHSNEIQLPSEVSCEECGREVTVSIPSGSTRTYCIDYGELAGIANIDYNVTAGNVDIDITYNGVTSNNPNLSGSGTVSFTKTNPTPSTASIVVTGNSTNNSLTLTFDCVTARPATVVEVTISSEEDATKTITNQYSYTHNNIDYGVNSKNVTLASGTFPIVSQEDTTTGSQGQRAIPVHESLITFYSRKISPNDFEFDPTQNGFYYYVSNAPLSIPALLASPLTPVVLDATGAPNVYRGTTSNVAIANNDYIYLVYDYRKSTSINLCYDAASASDACCECTTCSGVYSMSTSTMTSDRSTLCPVAAYTQTYYYEGAASGPEINDRVWQDAGRTIPLPGGWYKVSTGHLIYVNDSASSFSVISLKQVC